jgi:PAS domain S-box-containing protein
MDIDLAALGRALFDESGDALFLFDPETERLLAVNPTAERLSGFPREELLRQPIDYLFRGESPSPGALQRLRRAGKKTGVFHSQEGFLLRHRQAGAWVPVSLTVARLHVEPRPLGLITARDLSERRREQQKAARLEAELRQILSGVPVYLWSMDVDADGALALRYLSPVVERITGRPAAYFLADPRRWWLAVHPEDRSRLDAALARIRSQRLTRLESEYRLVRPDGALRWVRDNLAVTWGADGRSLRLDGVVTDVTGHREAEAALGASEARYRSLIENLEQSIFLKDREFRFVAANGPFCRGLGVAEADVLGKTDYDFYPAGLADQYRSDDRLVLRDGRRIEREEENLIGGRLRTVRVVKTPVKDAAGANAGVLGIFWDVTEQRDLEAQLRQAQKMEAVGRLAGGVAHDFNNLLTAVLGNASLLQQDLPAGDPKRDWARAIEVAAQRAAGLTRQLLGFARQTVLRPQPVDLNGVVAEVVGLLRYTIDPRIRLEAHAAADLGAVEGDPGQLHQVLVNLCLNARDAMPDGGLLRLETEGVHFAAGDERLPYPAAPGDYAVLRVRDTGHGIPAQVLPRIYDPFFTTKEPGKGSGLGLAMVYGIVQQHRGWIACESTEGQGTCFAFYLPRLPGGVEAPPPEEAKVRSAAPAARVRETVLLAEDEATLRDLGRTVLRQHGYRVLLAEDGEQAVEVYRREGGRVDLVILDLTMPRLSGLEALRLIRRHDPRARVLLASGYSSEHLGEPEREHVLGFVAKPYKPAELARAVRAALDAPPARPAPRERSARPER